MLAAILSFTNWLWGLPMLILLVGGGLVFTVLLGGFQFLKLPYILKNTIGKAFSDKSASGKISGYQALTTALATTLGTGNIVGVALAIAYGGPGAVFWMWLVGLVASIIKYSEVTIAMKYREKNEKGEWVGGPMTYLSKGTGIKWLGALFALVAIPQLAVASSVQASSLGDTMAALGVPKLACTLFIVAIVVVVVYGGVTRIVQVTEKMIPFMSILYMAGGIAIIIINASSLPGVFASIFAGAFTGTAATGGFGGASLAMAVRWGVSRGIYSNDSGNGLTSIAHCNAEVKHPVQQGMWGVFEVFFDTLIVCTVTALTVLCSGVWKTMSADQGGSIAVTAFKQNLGAVGSIIVSVSLFLFVLSTVIVFVYYGEKMADALWGQLGAKITRLAYCAMLFIGSVVSLGVLIQLLDFGNAMIIIINMFGLCIMFKDVRALTKEYFSSVANKTAD
ncbi:MAG TPA: amino acid carrier protein [Clostridia bacterium]|nr:amino acid carrier protein [Clostridia bacterium]